MQALAKAIQDSLQDWASDLRHRMQDSCRYSFAGGGAVSRLGFFDQIQNELLLRLSRQPHSRVQGVPCHLQARHHHRSGRHSHYLADLHLQEH